MSEATGDKTAGLRWRWWFLPARIIRPLLQSVARAGYDIDDPDVVLRVQVQVLYACLASLCALVYSITHFVAGSALLTGLFIVLICGNAVLLGALHISGRLRAVSHGTLALAMASMCLSTYWTGGLRLTNACPFFISMIAAVFLLSWEGLPWAILSVLVPLGFHVAKALGYRFPDLVPPEGRDLDAFLTWLIAIVVVLLFALYYEGARTLSIRQRDRAEAARSRFLAHVSHELRTPLHAIMGMTREAQRSELSTSASHALETAQQYADDLLVLINDLVLLATMERDHFTIEPKDFDPVGEVERIASILRLRCEQQGLTFGLTVHRDTPRWVRGDDDRLRQVLMNLGANAIKYTPAGSVELTVEPWSPAADGSHGCRFTVRDTGVGIRFEDQDAIFEQFTKLAGPSPAADQGVGLGLTIVREIITAMKGSIELESAPGAGSTFSIVIPFDAAVGPRPQAVVLSQDVHEQPSLRVLLVDDDTLNVHMASMMLEELGHQVLVARNGRQALDRWLADSPDAILMDIQMPEMDGQEATRCIRRREQAEGWRPVPIIALTGHGTPEHQKHCLAAGATGCLLKPFRFEALHQAITSATQGAIATVDSCGAACPSGFGPSSCPTMLR